MTKALPTLREWLDEGPFALAMSSGFFGFFAHSGALSALLSAGFLPCRTAGSSAGALVAGMYSAGVSQDLLRQRLSTLDRRDFWDPSPGLGLLKGRLFRALLDEIVGDRTIETAAISFTASVFDLRTRRTAVLRAGRFSEAIHASCALPLLFHPVKLNQTVYSDGGIADRPGIAGLSDAQRILYHHLASRSPWRRPGSVSLRIPDRDGLVAVSTEGITRVNPFALDRGMLAFAQAERAMHRALDHTIDDKTVRLTVEK